MIKQYNEVIQIIDATTGNVITTIKSRLFQDETIRKMIEDIFMEDYREKKHGIYTKYGIEP